MLLFFEGQVSLQSNGKFVSGLWCGFGDFALTGPTSASDLLQGRNVLGWIIKAVHTELQEVSAKDFSWISRVMLSNKFTDNMKDGLRDVCLHLDITSSSRDNPSLEEQNVPRKVSWERAEGDDNDILVVVEGGGGGWKC